MEKWLDTHIWAVWLLGLAIFVIVMPACVMILASMDHLIK